VERKFRYESSCFRTWKQDDAMVTQKCFSHDFRYWKCKRFIKEKHDYEDLCNVVKDNYLFLKNTFIVLSCNSIWPYVDRNDFTIFARKCNFLENPPVLQATIDRLYIAVNVELEN